MELKIVEGRFPKFIQRDKGQCWHKYSFSQGAVEIVNCSDLKINGVQIRQAVQVKKIGVQVFLFIQDVMNSFQGRDSFRIYRKKRLEELLSGFMGQFLLRAERRPVCSDFKKPLRNPENFPMGTGEGMGGKRVFQINGFPGQPSERRFSEFGRFIRRMRHFQQLIRKILLSGP